MTADRATAEAVGTIFALLTLLLFAGASLPALGVLTDAAATGQEAELTYHAQRLSGELQTVDRLVRGSESPGTIARHVALPDRIGGERYTISVTAGGRSPVISLATVSGETTATAWFASETSVRSTTIPGGPVRVIRANGSAVIAILPESS